MEVPGNSYIVLHNILGVKYDENICEKYNIFSRCFNSFSNGIGTLFIHVPKACATGPDNQDKALLFLSDVVKLDMSLYTVSLSSSFVDFPPHWNGIAEEVLCYEIYRLPKRECIVCKR
jgi:hypothetical protein